MSKNNKKNTIYVHHPSYSCSHKKPGNMRTSQFIEDISCRECLRVIKSGLASAGRRSENKLRVTTDKVRCECGAAMVKRVNKVTGQEFLGCSDFPKCRITYKTKSSCTESTVEIPVVGIEHSFTFGPYKDITVFTILNTNPSYIVYLQEKTNLIRFNLEVYREAMSKLEEQRASYHDEYIEVDKYLNTI